MAILKFDYLKNRATWHDEILKRFEFPFFVKPANAGSSVGVHKVKSGGHLAEALQDAFDFDLKVLIEKGVAARELECAVLGNDEPRASSVGEIVVHAEFYDYNAKYINDKAVELLTPAKNLPKEVEAKIHEWSVLAFRVLQCRGMARVDFFLDKNTDELYLNEINTIPGFTKSSMYPRMWAASGLSYPDLLDELIRLAIENFNNRKALKTTYDSKKLTDQ
jgi:D-alanine-D-alanine ligase